MFFSLAILSFLVGLLGGEVNPVEESGNQINMRQIYEYKCNKIILLPIVGKQELRSLSNLTFHQEEKDCVVDQVIIITEQKDFDIP